MKNRKGFAFKMNWVEIMKKVKTLKRNKRQINKTKFYARAFCGAGPCDK